MAAITASMVGALRAKTDAPMMMCKKALTEADGDLRDAEVHAAALDRILDRQKTGEHFAQSVPRWCVVAVHTLEELVCHLCTPHIATLRV